MEQKFKKKIKPFIILFLLSAGIDSIILIFLKQLRFFFPVALIGHDKIVGYAQYYGYPFYFDTSFFLFFLIIPLCIILVAKYLLYK